MGMIRNNYLIYNQLVGSEFKNVSFAHQFRNKDGFPRRQTLQCLQNLYRLNYVLQLIYINPIILKDYQSYT